MTFENLVSNKALILEVLHNQWARDPRDGKAPDCLHFDEYCQKLKIKDGIDLGLFSVDAALKAALKKYATYVHSYWLGLCETDIEWHENLLKVKGSICENVNSNWDEYNGIIKKSYSNFIEYLGSDRHFYS